LSTVDALTDEAFLAAFSAGRIPPGDFGHPEHVRLAWIILGAEDAFWDAVARFRRLLRRYVKRHEVPQKYHETVTVAYMSLVNERRVRGCGRASDWPAFARANPDLLRWTDGPLWELYAPAMLVDPVAKEHFVLPGRTRNDTGG